MSEVRALFPENPVAANVRAELARRNIPTNRLQYLIGNNQAYWQRRTSGGVPMDANDLMALADLMQVDPGVFFAGAVEQLRARRDSNPQPSDLESNVVEVEFGSTDEPADLPTPAQVFLFPTGTHHHERANAR